MHVDQTVTLLQLRGCHGQLRDVKLRTGYHLDESVGRDEDHLQR